MNKYEPLHTLLTKLAKEEGTFIRVTFDFIEGVIESPLPPSAFKYKAWWANNPRKKAQVKAWDDAGFYACELSLPNRIVTFRKKAT